MGLIQELFMEDCIAFIPYFFLQRLIIGGEGEEALDGSAVGSYIQGPLLLHLGAEDLVQFSHRALGVFQLRPLVMLLSDLLQQLLEVYLHDMVSIPLLRLDAVLAYEELQLFVELCFHLEVGQGSFRGTLDRSVRFNGHLNLLVLL